jgi:hypothetical protein
MFNTMCSMCPIAICNILHKANDYSKIITSMTILQNYYLIWIINGIFFFYTGFKYWDCNKTEAVYSVLTFQLSPLWRPRDQLLHQGDPKADLTIINWQSLQAVIIKTWHQIHSNKMFKFTSLLVTWPYPCSTA